MVYDENKKQYVIFWATTIPGRSRRPTARATASTTTVSTPTTTKDFKMFTPARLFFDGGFNVIDATMLRVGGKYYLIVKDETLKPVKKNLRLAVGEPRGAVRRGLRSVHAELGGRPVGHSRRRRLRRVLRLLHQGPLRCGPLAKFEGLGRCHFPARLPQRGHGMAPCSRCPSRSSTSYPRSDKGPWLAAGWAGFHGLTMGQRYVILGHTRPFCLLARIGGRGPAAGAASRYVATTWTGSSVGRALD